MKVNCAAEIVGWDGDVGAIDNKGTPATIRWAIWAAVNTPVAAMPWSTPTEILRCARLAEAAKADEVDYSRDDLDYIMSRALHVHSPLVYVELMRTFADPADVLEPKVADE